MSPDALVRAAVRALLGGFALAGLLYLFGVLLLSL